MYGTVCWLVSPPLCYGSSTVLFPVLIISLCDDLCFGSTIMMQSLSDNPPIILVVLVFPFFLDGSLSYNSIVFSQGPHVKDVWFGKRALDG